VLLYRLLPSWQPGEVLWGAWTGVVRTGRARGWRFALVGLVAGMVLVAGGRGVVASGSDAGGWWLRVGAVLVGLAALAAVIALMVRWYLRHRAAQDDPFPMLTALVLSAVATGLAVVAFAGVATLVWRAGLAAPPRSATPPGYARVERSYLWILVDSVPVLDLPQRLGWVDPLPLAGLAADVVRLVYRFVLLVPLIRVAQATYAWAKSSWLRAYERRTTTLELINRDLAEEPEWVGTPGISSGVPTWRAPATRHVRRRAWHGVNLTGTGQLVLAGLAVLAVMGSGYLPRLPALARLWPGGGPAVSVAGWLATGLSWLLAAWLVVRWFRSIPRRGEDLIELPLSSVTVVTVAWIIQIICAAAALLNPLVRAGLTTATPVRGGPTTLLEILAWQVTDVLPGPNIVEGLHWRRPGSLDGLVAGLVEIAVLVSVAALLAFPIGRALHVWSQRTSRWRDPDLPEPERVREMAVLAAADDLLAAERAVHELGATARQSYSRWASVTTSMSFPWKARTLGRDLEDWLEYLLRPDERRVRTTVTAAERALTRAQNARLRLAAAGADDLTIAAFDAAAAAIRRSYLYLGAHDPNRRPQAKRAGLTAATAMTAATAAARAAAIAAHLPHLRRTTTEVDDGAADRVAERAERAAAGFADLLTPAARQCDVSWPDLPVTVLGARLDDVPVADLLEHVTAAPFRQRWDFAARLPVVLGVVANRPGAQVAEFALGLLAAERKHLVDRDTDPRPRFHKPDLTATHYLLGLIHRQDNARIAETAHALLSQPPAGDSAGEQCAWYLLDPYLDKPADLMRLCVQLHDSGHREFAEQALDFGLEGNHEMSQALDELHGAGRDDLRPWLLSLASHWGATADLPARLSPDVGRGVYLVRLVRLLREQNSPAEDFLALLGRDVPRPDHLRERLTRELRQSTLAEDRWTVLL
jgi:hypothetical protein